MNCREGALPMDDWGSFRYRPPHAAGGGGLVKGRFMAVQNEAISAVRPRLWALSAWLLIGTAFVAFAEIPAKGSDAVTSGELTSAQDRRSSADVVLPDLGLSPDGILADVSGDARSDETETQPVPPSLGFDRPLFADEDDRLVNQIHLSFAGKYLWSPIAGYTQIPKKAKRQSTSHQRPRLSQMGVWDATIPDLELAASYGPHQLFVGAQIIRFSGRGQTEQPLITEGLRLTKNAHLRSTLSFDWYRFGYRYSIPLFQAENGVPTLTITPQINAIFWDFNYRVVSGKQRATAQIQKFNGQGGVDVEWRPRGGPFSIDVTAMASPPADTLPLIAFGEAAAKYRFVDTPNFNMNGSLGVAVERIDYHDAHLRATHIRADFGPMITGGLEFHF